MVIELVCVGSFFGTLHSISYNNQKCIVFSSIALSILIQINAEDELPAIVAKNSHAFLETASDQTKHEYLQLEEDRKMSKIQKRYLQDALIKNEPLEVWVS